MDTLLSMSKKPLEFDCIAGSQIRDTQGEMLDVAGADISHLEQGLGIWNDNHGLGFFNTLGKITSAKKIMKAEDCENERHTYYWEKIKAPYIYARGQMFDDDDHPNAKAAAAILRNIHNSDCPLKLKASVEGGVLARGIGDPRLLARTKITKVALTFTPANNATLVEPLSLDKSDTWVQDAILIKSVMHLAKTDVPSFRHITRRASAEKIVNNFDKIREIAKEAGLKTQLPHYSTDGIIRDAVLAKVKINVEKINKLIKMHSEEELDKGIKGWLTGAALTGASLLSSPAKADMKSDMAAIAAKQRTEVTSPAAQLQNAVANQQTGKRMQADSAAEEAAKPKPKAIYFSKGPTSSLYQQSVNAHMKDSGATFIEGQWSHPELNGSMLLEHAKQKAFYGHPSVTSTLGKALTAYNEDLVKISKKQLNQMLSSNPDVADWISKNLKRDDLATWFAREYKKDPSIFNDKNKTDLAHHVSIANTFNSNLRLDKTHDFNSGMDALKQNGDNLSKQNADKNHLVQPSGTKFLDLGNGKAWYSLGKGSCSEEAKSMGHCGNEPSEVAGDDILSLREEHRTSDGKIWHKPTTTVINNDGYLGESKGRANTKPQDKEAMTTLLKDPRIKANIGGGYDSSRNFNFNDLDLEDQKELAHKYKPLFKDLNPASADILKNSRFGELAVMHNRAIPIIKKLFHNANAHMGTLSYHDSEGLMRHSLTPSHVAKKLFAKSVESSQFPDTLASPYLHPAIYDDAIKHSDADVRAAAVASPHFKPEHMDKALNDENAGVRRSAVESPHFKLEHMDKALNDKNAGVRQSAVRSSHFKPEHMDKALNDEDPDVRWSAVKSSHFKPEHIDKALNDKNAGVRAAAVASPHYKSYLKKALTAGYGGASAPGARTGGSVLQSETIDLGRGFKHIKCNSCGDEQVYMQHQVKCRRSGCGKHFSFAELANFLRQ